MNDEILEINEWLIKTREALLYLLRSSDDGNGDCQFSPITEYLINEAVQLIGEILAMQGLDDPYRHTYENPSLMSSEARNSFHARLNEILSSLDVHFSCLTGDEQESDQQSDCLSD